MEKADLSKGYQSPKRKLGVTTHFYPAVRTGSSNTHFFFRGVFFGGHLPQTSAFRSAKEILVVSFATQPRAFILSDRNIFYTPPRGGRTTAGSNAPGAFLVQRKLSLNLERNCHTFFVF